MCMSKMYIRGNGGGGGGRGKGGSKVQEMRVETGRGDERNKSQKKKKSYKSLVRFFELHCTKYHVIYLVVCGVLYTNSERYLPCSSWGPVYTQ